MNPVLVAETPAGWRPGDVPRPIFAEDTTTTITQWDAHTSADGRETVLTACAATPIPGWVEDMRTPIANRSIGFVASTAERMVGAPVEARPDGRVFVLRAAGAPPDAPHVGTAQTWLGFDESRVFNCFVICAARLPRTERTAVTCESSVDVSRLEGGSAPPKAGFALSTVTWAVHHPFPTTTAALIALVIVSALAVARRRRPRARI